MSIVNLISGLNAMCVQYTDFLKDAFWSRAKARLEEVFSVESDFEDCQSAIMEAVHRAFHPEHWQFVVECIGRDFGLIHPSMDEEFFSRCDTGVLEGFVANEENGVVSTTFLHLATEETLESKVIRSMHLSLSGLETLAKTQKEWGEPLQNVAEVFEGFCLLRGEEGQIPPSLLKRYDRILGGVPAPKEIKQSPSLATAPARKIKSKTSSIEMPTSVDPNWKGSNLMAEALKQAIN